MLSGLKEAKLEVPGACWMDGSDFHFTALGTSDEFACDYTMDLLIPQVPNKNMTYRHRHTPGEKNKIIPTFGTAVKAEKVMLEGKKYLRTEFKVPTKTPKGVDLDHNIIYMNWIKKMLEEKTDPGISYHWQYELNEDKTLKYATLLEIAGTADPACHECRVGAPLAGEVAMDEKLKKEIEGADAKKLQAMLEQLTLEKEQKEELLKKKLEEIDSLTKDRDQAKADLGQKMLDDDKKDKIVQELSKQLTEVKLEVDAIKAENVYLKSPKKAMVDELVSLDGDKELEDFYKGKDEAWLTKRLEKVRPKPEVAGATDPARKMLQARKKLEDENPKNEEIMNSLAPNLRADFAEIIKKEGDK